MTTTYIATCLLRGRRRAGPSRRCRLVVVGGEGRAGLFVGQRSGRWRAAQRLGGRRLDEAVRGLGALGRGQHERVAQDDRAADRLQAERAIRLAAERVVDLGDDARHAESVLRQLRGEGVAVVALGERHDQVGLLGAGGAHDVLVRAAAADGLAAEALGQAREGARVDVDDDDLLTALVELRRDPRSDAAAADDDHPHGVCASSFVSARRHQTGAVELRMTYGTVRPASHCPPNRFL